jgi:hypothetical protein
MDAALVDTLLRALFWGVTASIIGCAVWKAVVRSLGHKFLIIKIVHTLAIFITSFLHGAGLSLIFIG